MFGRRMRGKTKGSPISSVLKPHFYDGVGNDREQGSIGCN
jgi:hypothetical protein